MNILKKEEKFIVKDNDFSVTDLINNLPEELVESAKSSSVVILPSHGTKNEFYSGTIETYDFLNGNNIATEISETDDNYKELSLHGAEIWLGSFLIKNFIIPVFCSVIAAYIYDKLKAKKDDNISLKFIVEKKDGNTSSVSYEGKVENLPKVLDEVKNFSDEN